MKSNEDILWKGILEDGEYSSKIVDKLALGTTLIK